MKTEENNIQTQARGLKNRIARVRIKRFFVRTITGIAYAMAVLVGILAAEMTLDYFVELPWMARACGFAGALGGFVFWLWRDAIHPLCKHLTEDDIANIIEDALPAFKTRFIASIQLARAAEATEPHVLVRSLIAQTALMAAKQDFRRVIKTERMKNSLNRAVQVAVIICILAHYGGAASPILLQRAMLSSVSLPRKTQILSVTGDRKIGIGEDLKIEVTAGGVLPPNGRIIANIKGRPQREFTLEHDPASKTRYFAQIRSPQESFTYYVKLNDDTSKTFTVETTPRPVVVDVNCEQVYPEYVGLPPVQRSVGDLSLLVGSRLRVAIKANVGISKGSLHLEGINKEVDLKVDPYDQTQLKGEFEIPPKDLTGFSARLVNTSGVASGDSATYRIDLIPDREPTVKITYPVRREELATSQATLLIAFEAKDDYGVTEATLHYMIDQGEEKTIPFDLGGKNPKTLKNRFDWKLSNLQPRVIVGSAIEFWITVADGNTLTGPGIGTSEHYQTKIVNEDEKRLDIQNRVKDTMGGVNEIKSSQEDLNKTFGEIIFEKQK